MKQMYRYIRLRLLWFRWFYFCWCYKPKYKLRVDSNNKNAGVTKEYGLSWKKPLATLEVALQISKPKTIIFVAFGHTEVISNSNELVVDKPDIFIIGCGFEPRPTFTILEKEIEKKA